MLYGFAGSGKTTLGKKYGDRYPLTLVFEGDEIVSMISNWVQYENEARKIVTQLTHAIVREYLATGNNVVVPYLPTLSKDLEQFESIANQLNATFIEIFLDVGSKKKSIDRLFKRGSWGEKDAPPLTEKDIPVAEQLYSDMKMSLKERNINNIMVKYGKIDETLDQIIKVIGA